MEKTKIFIIDVSGSMNSPFNRSRTLKQGKQSSTLSSEINHKFEAAKQYLATAIINLANQSPASHVVIISFAETSSIVYQGNVSNPNQIKQVINSLEADGGGTNLASAFQLVINFLSSANTPVIRSLDVITDGLTNQGEDPKIPADILLTRFAVRFYFYLIDNTDEGYQIALKIVKDDDDGKVEIIDCSQKLLDSSQKNEAAEQENELGRDSPLPPSVQPPSPGALSPQPNKELIFEAILGIKQHFFNNSSSQIIKGILLYTDGDMELVNYINRHFNELNILSGEWSEIYILENIKHDFQFLNKYWRFILYSSLYQKIPLFRWFTKKPFNKAECYEIGRALNISPDQFPCLVLLPPLTKISGDDKLIIPIQEVSTPYFRKLFSLLEDIVKTSQEANKYEAIKIKFENIVQYLEENSQRVITKTTREYQINGTNIFVNNHQIRSNVMTEGETYNVYGQAGAVGRESKSDYNTFIQLNPDYFQELKNEVKQLLDELNKENAKESQVIEEIRAKIKYDVTFRDRLINAFKAGGIEAIKAIFNHPFINIPIETVKGFIEAEARK
ncbi:MAG: vWA domain-containing protein [Planktothrix sp.]